MRKAKGKTEPVGTVASGAVPAEALEQSFPSIRLPIHPPYPPAEAKSVAEIPSGEGWLYEPKWDGFRCLAFRSGDQVLLRSEEHTSELQSRQYLVCRLLLEKKKT